MKIRNFAIGTVVLLLILTLAVGVIYFRAQTIAKDKVQALKDSVIKGFHDPESARFRSIELRSVGGTVLKPIQTINMKLLLESSPSVIASLFTYDPERLLLYGEVNAKNAFGAYVGYRSFCVGGGAKPVLFIEPEDEGGFVKRVCAMAPIVVLAEP
jgi:hypothetical protein